MALLTAVCLAGLILGSIALRLGDAYRVLAYVFFAASYLAGGWHRVQEGIEALREWRLDINFLMIAGAVGAAFIGRPAEGATLMFLFALSTTLEEYAMGRTRRAIEELVAITPREAVVERNGVLTTVHVDELRRGDRVFVKPGDRIPADGVVAEGHSDVDQAPITGESIPVDKGPGAPVFAGTINGRGSLVIEVTKLAEESTLARIVRIVAEAQASKAESQRVIDWIDRWYTLYVVFGAVVATIVPPLFFDRPWDASFYLAMTLLVVASPCALVISTPAAILSGIAAGARRGVLFKGGLALELMGQVDIVAFDKTGTLTSGKPGLTDVFPWKADSKAEVLAAAAAVESSSEHPLARAIVEGAAQRGVPVPQATEFKSIPGEGVQATVEGRTVWVGSRRAAARLGYSIDLEIACELDALEANGHTTMVVARDGDVLGCLSVADTVRPEAAEAVQALIRQRKRVVMLTGDSRPVAEAIATRLGIREVHSELMPEDKVAIVQELTRSGRVAMVGDGVNDAPALATAHVGVAMGAAGTGVALETADVVLMASDLSKTAFALELGRRARRTVTQNLAFSMIVIAVLVVSTLMGAVNLPLGVIGHEGSTILVALNGLRLLKG